MAVNQPIIGSDQADNSWKLEVTAQANVEEARVNALVSRIEQLEAMLGASTGDDGPTLEFDQVNVTPPSILRINNRVLTTAAVSTTGILAVNNIVQLASHDGTVYQFQTMDAQNMLVPANIPDTHQLHLGGQKLIEGVDYNLSDQRNQPGQLVLTSVPSGIPSDNLTRDTNGIMIELSIWSI